MADIWTKAKRSQVMSSIRSKGNLSTEMRLIALFRKAKITGWRRHPKLPGKPDFLFPQSKLVVFVDGDFWHGNPATYKPPKSNVDFWDEKVRYNRKNDRRITKLLRTQGWRVLRVWESSLRKNPDDALRRLLRLHQYSNIKHCPPERRSDVKPEKK